MSIGRSLKLEVKASMQNAIEGVLDDVWDRKFRVIADDLMIGLNGYTDGRAHIWLTDINLKDDPWIKIKLRALVAELIEELDGTCSYEEEAEWCDSVAADMEYCAKRLRRHAKKLEKEAEAEKSKP